MKVLLDVDTDVSDSIALLYTLLSPKIEIVGISAVCGNMEAWLVTEDITKMLDLAGAPDIPVAVGARKPPYQEQDDWVVFVHGKDGLGDMELPPSRRGIRDVDVSWFHTDLAEQYEGELVAITFDPLTNVARTIREYPGFAHKVRGLVIMGGTLTMYGNVSPMAKTNMACDPQICDQVSTSGTDITVVEPDVTMGTGFKTEHLGWLSGCCRPACRPAVDHMRQATVHYLRGNQTQNYCMGNCPFHDPLAAICAVMPNLTCTENRKARTGCGDTYCRGMIVTDLREHPLQAEYVRFAVEVDSERAVRELMSVFWE